MKPLLHIVALCLLAASAYAQEFSGVYEVGEGSRIDFMEDSGPKANKDQMTNYRMEFTIPEQGENASMRLIPMKDMTHKSEDYKCIVFRGDGVIWVLPALNNTNLKLEVYTLYPKKKYGFLTVTDAFMGMQSTKDLAPVSPAIPHATGKIFPLRKID